jgi:membrane-bound lytic murein transglycosylase MltF
MNQGEAVMTSAPRSISSGAWLVAIALAALATAIGACGGSEPAATVKPPAEALPAAEPDIPITPPAYEAALPEGVRSLIGTPFKGDFDQMVARRLIRVGVTYNRTFYFADRGVQRGVSYEYAKAFEDWINQKLKTGNMRINAAIVPMPRDQLPSALLEGKVDFVLAQVTIRPELEVLMDFSKPTRTNVSEVVVTGPGGPAINSVDDLSGQEVFARKGGNFWASLVALNEQLEAKGKPPVALEEAPGNLEDDDLLEMVNAGIIPAIVVHDYVAEFWKKVFTDLTVHDTVTVRTGASFAVPIRKNSPMLAAELNAFISKYGLGTTFGTIMEKRYLVSTKYVKSAASEAERKKFLALTEFFKKYSDKYQMDYLLMAAQGYQESALNQDAKSQVGAIGVMQIMPATGKDLNVGDITQTEPNIHGGVKYMRWMIDTYFKNEPMSQLDKGLFAFAAYNAGPGTIIKLRKQAAKRGLDPNVWFGNVEQIASERIGRETVTYVSNIYKYYVAYKLLTEEDARRKAAKASMKTGTK